LLAQRETEWGPDNLEERLRHDEEVVRFGRLIGHRELLLLGVSARIADLMELRGLNHVEADILEFARAAEQLHQPRYLWRVKALQTLQAWSRGDFRHAESLIQETSQFGERTPGSQPDQVIAVQTWRILADRGHLERMRPQIEAFVREFAAIPSWRCALAQVYFECGLQTEAKRTFQILAQDDFAILPRDRYWIPGVCIASEVCALLNDSSRARILYRILLPYEDRYVVIGPTAACLGSIARYLGLLASTIERWPEASRHFERALAANEHTKPMLVRTQYEYALMLLGRGRRSDHKKAHDLLSNAYEAATSMEMTALARKLHDLLCRLKKSA
jgi:tetratricopeptide (TPR) repeat protein